MVAALPLLAAMTSLSPRSVTVNPVLFAVLAGLFVFFWASGFIAAKYGMPYAEPFTLMVCRFAVASAIMLPACFILKAAWPKTLMQTIHILVSGFGVTTVYLIGVYCGISFGVSTGVTALIVGLQPLLTGVLAGLLLKEKVTPRNWIGLLLGFAGLALVVWDRVVAPTETLYGLAFLILGLIGITLGTLYQRRFCGSFDLRSGVAMQHVLSLAVMLVLAESFETMHIEWTGEFVFAVLWSAIALSVVAICLYFWLLRAGAAARITSLIYLSPPTTAIMGWAMFGEVMSWKAIGGMILAMSGVALAVRAR